MARGRPASPCSIDGCERTQRAHGWCNMHYKRWQRNGHPTRTQRKTNAGSGSPSVCSEYGCERPERSDGKCWGHLHGTHSEFHPRRPRNPVTRSPERVFDYVDVGDCWEWQAYKDKDGYGKFRFDNKHHRAHRFVYELLVGDIPDGLVTDHLCKNTSCVNPDHLEPVTVAENLRRGESIQARNARKRECIRGHEYSEHGGMSSDGYRFCRTCAREMKRERRAKAVA